MSKNNEDPKGNLTLTEIQKEALKQTLSEDQLALLDKTLAAAEKLAPLAKNKTVNQVDQFLDPLMSKFGITKNLKQKVMDYMMDRPAAEKIQKSVTNSINLNKASSGSHAGLSGYSEEDVIDMGLMLYVETDWYRSEVEHEAIIQVALNRVSKYGKSVYDVVKPHTGGWNNSDGYAKRWVKGQKAIDNEHPRWLQAKATIIKCLSGNSSIDIGDCLNFLHPNGMSVGNCEKELHKQNCPGSARKCIDYDKVFPELKAGVRCIPTWAIHVSDGGRSKTPPKLYGKALVCNGTLGGTSSVDKSARIKNLGGGALALNQGVVSNSGSSKIVGIGDSITVGYGNTSWLDFLGGKKFARGGWSSTAIKNLIFYKYIFDKKSKDLILEESPEFLIILAGVNNHLSPQKVIDDLQDMAKTAQAAGIKVKMMTLLPTGGFWDRSKRYPEGDKLSLKRIGIINSWIRGESWASLSGSGHVDTSAMGDSTGKLINSGDGIHPNSRGQKQLSMIVKRSL